VASLPSCNMVKNNDLLIRIDERQKEMAKDIADIRLSLNYVVQNDDEYKDIKKKVGIMWEDRMKMIGYMIGSGITGGAIGALLKQTIISAFTK